MGNTKGTMGLGKTAKYTLPSRNQRNRLTDLKYLGLPILESKRVSKRISVSPRISVSQRPTPYMHTKRFLVQEREPVQVPKGFLLNKKKPTSLLEMKHEHSKIVFNEFKI
jgi:hypothetical protein